MFERKEHTPRKLGTATVHSVAEQHKPTLKSKRSGRSPDEHLIVSYVVLCIILLVASPLLSPRWGLGDTAIA